MLPEHVKMVKRVWKEDERIEKPILDEQQWEEIGYALQLALKDNLPINLKFHNGFNYSSIKVKVISFDIENLRLKCVDDHNRSTKYLSLSNVCEVSFL
ncbi:YolD-like family protein [Halobacillus sp. MO56]